MNDAPNLLDLTQPDWPRSPLWPGVPALAEAVGVRSVTAVDPGEVHMGVVRVELTPQLRVTHWRIVDLHAETAARAATTGAKLYTPSRKRAADGSERFDGRAVQLTLAHLLRTESRDGGMFDSDFTLVESQEFRNDMRGIEQAIVTFLNATREPLHVHDGEGGLVPRAHSVSGTSVKACYGGLFPTVIGCSASDNEEDDDAAVEQANRANNGRKAFMKRNRMATAAASAQYTANKRNAQRYGPLVAHVDCIAEHMGARLPAEHLAVMREHIRTRKTDDVYDAMFIVLYAINTWLFNMYIVRFKGTQAKIQATRAPALRAKRQFEELYEFMCALGNSANNIVSVRKVLFHEP